MNFIGQVALVTGSATSIGQATARLLAERGARVLAVVPDEAAAESLTRGDTLPALVEVRQANVRELAAAEALVAEMLTRWGQLDVLVHCAQATPFAFVADLVTAQWHATLDANLHAAFAICKAVVRPMMRRRYGRIVNIAALHGVAGGPGQADFSAATGGLLGMTRALAREVAPWNITVNAVAIGLVADETLGHVPPELRAWSEQIIALRRPGRPEEIAAAAVFLASPLASYITGQTLAVDGGWRMA